MEHPTFNRPYAYTGELPNTEYEASLTVPNMAMSLNEILTRYTNGTLPNSNEFLKETFYNNGTLSPLSRKGVGLEDFSAIKREAESDITSSKERLARLQSQLAEVEDELSSPSAPPAAPPAAPPPTADSK